MAERAREREREREREKGGPPITLKQALGGSQSRRSRMVSMEMMLE